MGKDWLESSDGKESMGKEWWERISLMIGEKGLMGKDCWERIDGKELMEKD